ncbi:monofunctional biosynthetic peptidoglycan transglycosylase [Rubrivivax gelatinosus]|uniref:Biosynthetic peptidoglycan transglycosylase n=1 Tax=Rubrivivax gelatinosus TaxID=28068 RepID=A0ABS1DSR3_RUBGE|nr:monofunctional biosynthetic peptidoglycan transglycosylase [Rubrivivax gelatinosus]MBK1613143.1 monofunctional biosynthetic peptidoglycan transglycosylase [Rubrivivax gelatinosus]MBK1712630.1 monofunctional biosynthetic peptidoglycan transglycosylase [Rubrivivax gelatinosus]
MKRQIWRLAALVVICGLALQLFFALRVAAMVLVDPQSSAFQRSEAWRLLVEQHTISWSQDWVPRARLGTNIQRAVIASEDAGFTEHSGVEWDAIEQAWERNQRAEARFEAGRSKAVKIRGGSTITQQLAKNLLLSGERTALRKAQELAITMMLEAFLSKERILEIYLNNVEWGEGVFGAQAAARHYFRTDALQLSATQAARLAVMLPAPKRFEKRANSGYVAGRAQTIVARMGAVELP